MRTFPLALLLYSSLLLGRAFTQQSPTENQGSGSEGQAIRLLRQSIAATDSGTSIADAVISGAATYHSGNEAIPADIRLEFKGTSQSRLDLNTGNLRSEIRNGTFKAAHAQFRDETGKVRQNALHNCQIPPTLLFPPLLLPSLLENDGQLQYIGAESLDGVSVDHVRYSHSYKGNSPHFTQVMQKLSTLEIYLDSKSHQVLKVSYNAHPDDNALRDLLAEVRFSDYQQVNGILVPYHVKRLLQGADNLDFTVNNVLLNSGVQDSEFPLQ